MTTNTYTSTAVSEPIRPRRRDGQRGRTVPDIIKNLPCNCPKDRHFRQLYGGSLSYRRHLRGCNQHAAADLFHRLCQFRHAVGQLYLYTTVPAENYRSWYFSIRRMNSGFTGHLVMTLRNSENVYIFALIPIGV